MSLSRRRKVLFALPVFILAYLVLVACWALATFDEAMANARVRPDAQLTPRQTAILSLVEDPKFLTHIGVSLGNGQGLATISSAVARDVYLFGKDFDGVAGALQWIYRRVFECCKKIDLGRDVMAVVLNAKLSKDRQLAIYVSNVYLGRYGKRQLRGLPQAAENYFGKNLSAMSEDEFIRLVAMIKAPNQFHPLMHASAYETRVTRVRALVAGTCRPAGWFDTTLEHCGRAAGSPSGSPR